jgi:hypothetical protein
MAIGKRIPIDDPRWLPMKEAIEARQRQIGTIERAVTDLEAAMGSGKLRAMRRDLATGAGERVEPAFWRRGHEIDVMPGLGSVAVYRRSDERPADRPRRWADFDHFPDVHLGAHVYFVWKPDLDALLRARKR